MMSAPLNLRTPFSVPFYFQQLVSLIFREVNFPSAGKPLARLPKVHDSPLLLAPPIFLCVV